jgi:hypothetical protein
VCDLGFEPRRQLAVVTGAQLLQPPHPVAPHWLVVINAMDRAQSLDSVDVLATFGGQPITLTVQPTVILFGDAWHPQYTPHFRLTAQIRHQRSPQLRLLPSPVGFLAFSRRHDLHKFKPRLSSRERQ